MEFRLPFTPKPFKDKIKHDQLLFLAGSCFTEQIGSKLSHHKFRIIENPNGILFNPYSISTSINTYIEGKKYHETDLFFANEIWASWDHHTRFSAVDKQNCLQKINASQQSAHDFLKKTDWLILTLGSSFVYENSEGRIVANCHKIPTDHFNKRMLSVFEIKEIMQTMINALFSFNNKIKVIFTISPVRHLRDGFIENNRSKANLITATHEIVEQNERVHYFPAYELVIDDLRDYRFFAEDMVHPNYAATQYVWEKFNDTCVDESSRAIMKEIALIQSAKSHKPFNPESTQHRKFLNAYSEKVSHLQIQLPYVDFNEEIAYFSR